QVTDQIRLGQAVGAEQRELQVVEGAAQVHLNAQLRLDVLRRLTRRVDDVHRGDVELRVELRVAAERDRAGLLDGERPLHNPEIQHIRTARRADGSSEGQGPGSISRQTGRGDLDGAAQVDVGFRGLEPRVGAQINRHVVEIEASDQFWRAIWQQTSIYEERRVNQVIELRIVEIHNLLLIEIREKDAALIEYDRTRQHRRLLRTPQTKRVDGPDTRFGRDSEIRETEPVDGVQMLSAQPDIELRVIEIFERDPTAQARHAAPIVFLRGNRET